MLLMFALACSPFPDTIPKEPGTITGEDDLRRLWLVAGPESVYRLFQLLAGLEVYVDSACPVEEGTPDGSLFAGGCTDKYGGIWTGDATQTEYLMNEIQLEEFGLETSTWVEMYGAELQTTSWTLDGIFRWSRVDNTADQRIEIEAAVVYSDAAYSYDAWMDLEAYLAYTPDRIYDVSGEIGLEGWGTAEIALDDTQAGASMDPPCPYPVGGSLTVTGANAAQIALGAAEPFCSPCPAWTLDGESGELCEPLPYLATPYPKDEEADTGVP